MLHEILKMNKDYLQTKWDITNKQYFHMNVIEKV